MTHATSRESQIVQSMNTRAVKIVHENQLIEFSTNPLTGFFIVGTLGLKNLTNIKSTS